jgi:hypothetical chaperone protein
VNGDTPAAALGLDFGTTNTVVALADGRGGSELVEFAGEHGSGAVFRSALCFWEEDRAWQGIACEAGPWAIAEYLQSPLDSRFVQSFKTVAATPTFERALVFGKPYRFEDFGRLFLQHLVRHASGRLGSRPRRVVVGRPVVYAGAQPDPALARQRYDLMLQEFGIEIHYVYEPLGAAYSYASRLTEPATNREARAAARRSPRQASALQATASTGASSSGWCCRCSAKAVGTVPWARCWTFLAAGSPSSPTGPSSR